MADNGLVRPIVAINSKENKVLCKPVIVSRGFVFIKDSQGLLREAEQIVYAALNEKMKERTTFSELKNCVRSTLEPFLYNKTHRNPIVIPVIINSKTAMAAMAQARAASNQTSGEKEGTAERTILDSQTTVFSYGNTPHFMINSKEYEVSAMVKKLLKIVSVLILLALIVAGVFFYSIYISVDRVNLSYQTISSSKIPEDMNDLKIAFISDIKYNEYMNKERLTSMISKLNTTGADVVIYGGDMFSEPQTKAPDSQMSKDLTAILKSIDAPLGKFAVLGDEDLANDKTKKIVSQIFIRQRF